MEEGSMTRFALACCCAFACGLAPAVAQTPPAPPPGAAVIAPSPEAQKIAAAWSKVTSFRVTLNSASGFGATVTRVLVPQTRTKMVAAMGDTASEVVIAGGRMYTRSNGGAWVVADAPGGLEYGDAVLKAMADPSNFRVLADRVEGGTTVGVFEVTPPLPPGMVAGTAVPPLSCTYDKKTYLPRMCGVQGMTQTFDGWNDPANAVDVPLVAPASPHP
jgi:hypothetical protein